MKTKPMYIIDAKGEVIEVSDLALAIAQAGLLMGYSHQDPSPAQRLSDGKRGKYWTDIYEKLLELKADKH